MSLLEQLPLDLSAEAQYLGRLAEDAEREFSEQALCLAWVTESDGRAWADWWDCQSPHARAAMLEDYRLERDLADHYTRGRMRPYTSVLALREEKFQEEEKAAAAWAAEIKQAAIERKPLPFSLHDHATGTERGRFEQRLSMAFQIAGVVIIAASTEPKEGN